MPTFNTIKPSSYKTTTTTLNQPAEMTDLDLEAQLSDPMPQRLNKEQVSPAESEHQSTTIIQPSQMVPVVTDSSVVIDSPTLLRLRGGDGAEVTWALVPIIVIIVIGVIIFVTLALDFGWF
jgi:hypothetical protein